MNSTHKHSQAVYEIIVQGELDQSWENFLESLAVTPGPVIDQAALRGLLCKLWDLNLTLISVRRLEVDCSEEERND
jgi:hypothetical protein